MALARARHTHPEHDHDNDGVMSIAAPSEAGWLAPRPHPRKPLTNLPAGAVDAHCHVFGPCAMFPYAPALTFTPAEAPKEKLFAVRDFLGFSRNVIVQAKYHGTDNRALVDALVTAGDRARGVACLPPGVTRAELADLHAAGIRGVRFDFAQRAHAQPDAYYQGLAERIAELGWHVVVCLEAADLLDRWQLLTRLPTVVVVDHLGQPDVSQPLDAPGFTLFQRFMREHGNVWAELSGAERVSVLGPPGYDDFIPFAQRIATAFPDRVIWGTDWPHPDRTSHMPDEGNLVDLIPRIAPDPDLQRKLLVDNPMRLYWKD
jgi:2-pyrone-4,6-dicarboxylate lactonase